MGFGDGVYGLSEVKQEHPGLFRRIPTTSANSLYGNSESMDLDREYTDFMDKHPKGNIYVGFGTFFMPPSAKMEKLIDAIRQLPDYGFIISIKETAESHLLVKEANLKNVLLKKFVPQKPLLHDHRIKTFISHGGGYSISEAVYFGKPLIGFPQGADQVGSCYRVERMGIAISVLKNPSTSDFLEAI